MKRPAGPRFLVCGASLALVALLNACQSNPTRRQADLKALQGSWEGDGAGGRCSITITGNVLHYQAGTNGWVTTFTLPTGTEPRQLHATIRETSPPGNGIGTTVFAIFKIEADTLTLAETDGSDQPPGSFEAASSSYRLKRVGTRN